MTALNPKAGVLLISNFLSPVGSNRGVCEDLALKLSRAGWRVCTTSSELNRLSRLIDMAATIWWKRHHYDIAQVDVFSGAAFIWAEISCWLLHRVGRPYILTLHGGQLPEFAKRWPGRVQKLLNSARVVTTPSRYLLEAMQPYCHDLRLLPNPLDLSHYPFCLRQAPRPHLIWLRAFHAIYNPTLAPSVLAELLRSHPEAQLTMIGPDKGDGSLQATQHMAQTLGVAERMKLPGGVPKADVPMWLNQGDIFINTTNIDNAPISVLEAMACGLCVVSTNVGGIPYLLEHGQDALLVPPNDPEAIAAAVRRFLTEPGLAEHLSRNARQKTEQFDWSVILPQWEELLLKVANKCSLKTFGAD